MLAPLGLFFIFSAFKYKNILKLCLATIIVINLIIFTNKATIDPLNIVNGKRQALICYRTATTLDLDKCYNTFTLHPNKEFLNQKIVKVLQYKKINNFNY